LCREEGTDLAALHKSGAIGNARMVGIIKEVAPVKTAATDKELGVSDFNTGYFPYPLYRDINLSFYDALGKRSILGVIPWNPFKLYEAIQITKARTKEKGIKGNMNGEGLVSGGVLVVSRDEGVVYVYKEIIGQPVPVEDIKAAVLACSRQKVEL
jgi:hypothetical protein